MAKKPVKPWPGKVPLAKQIADLAARVKALEDKVNVNPVPTT